MPLATVVINPFAGAGRALSYSKEVIKKLTDNGWEVESFCSTSIENAQELASQAVDQNRIVIALGGDGLAGRLAGVVADKDGVFAVLPGGRGNDFSTYIGLKKNPIEAALQLLQAKPRRIDLGMIGQRSFLGVSGVGFDAKVQQVAESSKAKLGGAIYAYAALKVIPKWRHINFYLDIDGQIISMKGWMVGVANSGVYGGGMKLVPDVKINDASLEVITISATSRMYFLRIFPKVFWGGHTKDPHVRIQHAAKVTISSDASLIAYADGEKVGPLPISIGLHPKGLTMLIPET